MSQILGLSLSKSVEPAVDYNETADSQPRTFTVTMYQESAPEFRTIKQAVGPKEKYNPPIPEDLVTNESDLYLFKLISQAQKGEPDSPPLVRRYSGYYVSMVFSGEFSQKFNKSIDIGERPFFIPETQSKAELAFCWILEQLRTRGCGKFYDLPWGVFLSHLRLMSLNENINILMSDGKVLIGFCNNSNDPLCYMSGAKAEGKSLLSAGHLRLDTSKLKTETQFVSLSSGITNDSSWKPIESGEMLVLSEGIVVWDSAIEPSLARDSKKFEAMPENEFVLNQTVTQLVQRVYASFEPVKETPAQTCVNITAYDQKTSIFSVNHETNYRYVDPVSNSKHLLRLHPVTDANQLVTSYRLTSSSAGEYSSFTGVFGNAATILDITEPYQELKIVSRSIVCINEPPAIPYHLLHEQLMIPLIWMPWDRIMMQAYLTPPELPESELHDLSSYATSFVRRNNNNILSVLNDINNTIYNEFAYVPHSTTLLTTPYDVYLNRRGVCQDFSNLFICLARLLNVPARYRVGYVYTGGKYDADRVPDQTHAWVEVYLPRIGWMGFDPTNGCQVGRSHIRVACGRNYRDATPTSGVVYGGSSESMSSFVQVQLLNP